MSDLAIEVDSVWKKFHRGEFHDSLRDFVPALTQRLLGRGPKRDELSEGDFWALKDVSFQVRHGEVLGIVGANGAGKSTLLKILAKILKPNRGHVRVNGRLRALIEVASGFHPDLTGRENVYLNGSILGMKKREIDAKFDEIVEFSEIGEFLDTPVKRYSSGMHARLGFAVAAHLDPEILIVDEVLAVGDAAFQKKCLGKMNEVAGGGRAILFVSHNMAVVSAFCTSSLVLDGGNVAFLGNVEQGIETYGNQLQKRSKTPISQRVDRRSQGDKLRIETIEIQDLNGSPLSHVPMGASLRIALRLACPERVTTPRVCIVVKTAYGQRLFRLFTEDQGLLLPDIIGQSVVVCEIPELILAPGKYLLWVSVSGNGDSAHDEVDNALTFEVVPADVFKTGRVPGHIDLVFQRCRWLPAGGDFLRGPTTE